MPEIVALVHPEAIKICLVLFLSFLLGIQREAWKAHAGHYIFGGVRTFPLIGLLGYTLALASGGEWLAVGLGLLAVAAFLLTAYRHKLATAEDAGMTTEMTGLLVFVLGAIVSAGQYWIATAVVVVTLLLLELKAGLEQLSQCIPPEETVTFATFLLLTAVILPVVPNRDFTTFALNPYKIWLIVVAVSAGSYGAYVLQRVTGRRGGIQVGALLGGAYSSTMMTVVLGRRSRRDSRPHLLAGSMLLAAGMTYLRVTVLLALFSRDLLALLGGSFLVLGCAALVGGWVWSRRPDGGGGDLEREHVARNPLELRSAFVFAGVFVAILIATRLVLDRFGSPGIYVLAVLVSPSYIDPFILSLAHSA
ncbi:MAG: MgtC/SapB family protein, partial [Acidobacteria bacterium]|nr:MgtC/SapB family protein [Acidobacteriota bacterium]